MLHRIERAALCMIGLMPLAPAALASDRIFVTEGAKVEAFQFDTGQSLTGSPIALSGTAGDVSRSRSGLYYYVVDDQGQVRVVNTRSTNVFVSPDPVPGADRDLSLDGLRGDILFATGSQSIHKQDAAGFGYSGSINFGSWDLATTAGLNNGAAVYAVNQGGELMEWSAATGSVSYIENYGSLVAQEMEASLDDRLVITVGNSEFSFFTGGHQVNQPALHVHDRSTGKQLYTHTWGTQTTRARTRVAVSGSDPTRFWVLVENEGVFAYQVWGSTVNLLGAVAGGGLDIASNDAGDLFVLHSDRVDRYAGGAQLDRTMPLPKKAWGRLEITSELPPPTGVMDTLRPEWAGMLMALELKGMLPPWKLDPFQSSGEGCDPEAVYGAMKRAFSWLETLEDEDGILDPTQVAQFLAAAEFSDPLAAEYFLDLLLIEVEGQ